LFGNFLADGHGDRLAVRDQQLGLIRGGFLGHAPQDDGGGNGRRVVHIVRPGHVEDRLAQFRGAPDGFIDGIQPGNTPQEDLFPLGQVDGVKHDPAEHQGQHQVVQLVPVHPVRFRRGDDRQCDHPFLSIRGGHRDGIGLVRFELDAFPVLEQEDMVARFA